MATEVRSPKSPKSPKLGEIINIHIQQAQKKYSEKSSRSLGKEVVKTLEKAKSEAKKSKVGDVTISPKYKLVKLQPEDYLQNIEQSNKII